MPGGPLPVAATDISTSDTDLDSTAKEVVVVTQGTDGPTVTKLRARTVQEAAELAAELDRRPGVSATLNHSFELPIDPASTRGAGKASEPISLPSQKSDSGLISAKAATLAGEEHGSRQWGMYAVGAEGAWTVTHGTGVTVAVVDSGVDASHPDLQGHVLSQIDIVPDGLTGAVTEHGTHVAGIIAASLNGTGVVGLADKVTILPIRVFGVDGSSDDYTVASGIIDAVDSGAEVINLSLGGSGSSSTLSAAVSYAIDNGITVVAAGGNEYLSGNPVTYPANYPGVLGVSSIDSDGYSSSFANTGSYIDLTAPGEEILSTIPDGSWGYMDGTSMATPFVSATAALVRTANPTLSGAQVSSLLQNTALDDASMPGKDAYFGHGLVQADKAARAAATAAGGILGRPVSVRVAKAGYGNVLAVNVNPDRGSANYVFRVQKATNGKWTTLSPVYRTEGSAETKSITLGAGTYRVVVPASAGYAAGTSGAVALTAPTVKVSTWRDSAKSKLKVDVNPNKGTGYWKFKVQKKTSAGWRSLSTYRTKGSSETRTVDLKAGTYRVVVAGKYGYLGKASAPVTLVK